MKKNFPIPKHILDMKVADLLDEHFSDSHRRYGACTRIINLLRHAPAKPVETVRDLVSLSERELRRLPNMGPTFVSEILQSLEKLKIKLAYLAGSEPLYSGEPDPADLVDALDVHERLKIDESMCVMGVRGGWIYIFLDQEKIAATCFVPRGGEVA